MKDVYKEWNASYKTLTLGFILSVVLILAAYFAVTHQYFSGWFLMLVVIGLGSLQALIQLVLFLHLGIESKPRWSLIVFLFMVLIAFVIIGGSIWIMYNLDYNMMPDMKH